MYKIYIKSIFIFFIFITGCGDEDSNSKGQYTLDPEIIEIRDSVDKNRYITDLNTAAIVREPGTDTWYQIQTLCHDRFEDLGYQVELHQYGTGVNVIGKKTGSEYPEEEIIISAHYDHIPGCTGADDNATGVAGVLEAARVLSGSTYERTLIVGCWDEEERGLIGSMAYAERASSNEERLITVYVFEMIGYKSDEPGSQELPAGFELVFPEQIAEIRNNNNRGDFIFFVGDYNAGNSLYLLEKNVELVGTPGISVVLTADQMQSHFFNDLKRSDHASFWLYNYSAIMISDTANFRNEAYHCDPIEDTVDRLDHDFATAVIKATVAAAAVELGLNNK